MITKKIIGDILASKETKIAFATNVEGYNDAGFAGAVARRHWPELLNCGQRKPGTIQEMQVDDRTFFAFVCHSLSPDGWANTPKIVQKTLDTLCPNGEEIACVMMGNGPVGKLMGADVPAILEAMAQSRAKVTIYSMTEI